MYHALPVEEIVGTYQEIPTERSEPRQVMRFVHNISYVNNFMETLDLYTEHLK